MLLHFWLILDSHFVLGIIPIFDNNHYYASIAKSTETSSDLLRFLWISGESELLPYATQFNRLKIYRNCASSSLIFIKVVCLREKDQMKHNTEQIMSEKERIEMNK